MNYTEARALKAATAGISELRAELAALRERIEALEARQRPEAKTPKSYTLGMRRGETV